ncbi:hypothetical protein D9619_011835 [Psilocybe cf. subviscida]|uniref:Uncharacterized protein n=1 Tax=Psilocybe cf. subviscida TaxID=2480587 RepID=A0A8H5EW16_9AGAR|nr:hypothetical protein D9619_011835 [Psilocybe cf. subviscida]
MSASTDRLLALFISALCTGVYFCTFCSCIRWMVFTDDGWRIRRHIRKGVLAATLAIAVFSTTHTVLAVTTSVAIVRQAESPTLSIAFSRPNAKLPWESLVMCTVVNTSVLIVDSFLIYRCWAVTSFNKLKIVFPVLFWFGGLVCTILQLYWQIVQTVQISNIWTPVNMSIGPGTVLTPFWGCTIVVNLYATGIIIYHIWAATETATKAPQRPSHSQTHSHSESQMQKTRSLEDAETLRGGASSRTVNSVPGESEGRESTKELRFIVRVLIESGALYLFITVPHFAAWFTSSSLAIVALGWANLPIVGTAFNLILVRTARRRADAERKEEEASGLMSEIKFEQPVLDTSGIPVTHLTLIDISHTSSGSSATAYNRKK